MNAKQKLKLFKELEKPENLNPKLTQISKKVGVPIFTIFDFVNKRLESGSMEIFIEVVFLSEMEALKSGSKKAKK